jgi:hypothetical protein
MSYTYARYEDYVRSQDIEASSVTAEEKQEVLRYLMQATAYIDRFTHRHFVPLFDTQMYSVPTDFIDLRRRALTNWDLSLYDDLIDAHIVRLHTGEIEDSTATLGAALTRYAIELTVSDTTVFEANDIIQIDSELMIVRYVDTANSKLLVVRGMFDSRPTAHDNASTINLYTMQDLTPGEDFNLLYFNKLPKKRIRLVWPNTWFGSYVSLAGQKYQPSIFVTGMWGFATTFNEAWLNTLDEIQVGGILATTTDISVDDADGLDDSALTRFTIGDMLIVDDEMMQVTAIDATADTITVLRARQGTVAVPHDAAVPIYRWVPPRDIVMACISIAQLWRQADRAQGRRQGVSDVSIGVELGVPKDAEQTLRAYAKPMQADRTG